MFYDLKIEIKNEEDEKLIRYLDNAVKENDYVLANLVYYLLVNDFNSKN